MKPLFPYYGSKTRLASWIINLLPDHTVYCEPFAGSAAVLFAKKPSKVEVLNDKSEDLINCFRCFADPRISRALWRRLVYTPYSRAEYNRANRILKDGGTDEDRAWAWLVSVSMSHGSQPGNGFGIRVSGNGSNIAETARASWSIHRGTAGHGKDAQWSRKGGVRAAAARLRNVVLECDDALSVIKRWDSPGTVFYVDCPYPNSDQGHYSGYTSEMFNELVILLDSIQGSFLLSNYEQPGIPDHWERFEKQVVLMAAKRKGASRDKRTEIVWRKLGKNATKQETLFPALNLM